MQKKSGDKVVLLNSVSYAMDFSKKLKAKPRQVLNHTLNHQFFEYNCILANLLSFAVAVVTFGMKVNNYV